MGLRSWRFRSTKLSASTTLDTKNKCSFKHVTANFLNPLLSAALLSSVNIVRSLRVEMLSCPVCVDVCAWEKKIKKGREGNNFSWVAEKNTLLQALVSALPCAACKSVFFCGWIFISKHFIKVPSSVFVQQCVVCVLLIVKPKIYFKCLAGKFK